MSQKLLQVAVRAISNAREEARRLGHAWLGTEHLLVGVARVRSGPTVSVLARTQLDDVDKLRSALASVSPPVHGKPKNVYLPLTARSRAALEQAAHAAHDLGRPRIGAEHILLGLLGDPSSAACGMVSRMGTSVGRVRGELLGVLRDGYEDDRDDVKESVAALQLATLDLKNLIEREITHAARPVVIAMPPELEPDPRPAPRPASRRGAPVPAPRPVAMPLYVCPCGHGPMEKLVDGDLEVGLCRECHGTFVPGGKLAAVLQRFTEAQGL